MDPQLLDILLQPPLGAVLAGIWGALWGSFLNVVIARLPRGESLLRPGSHCPACGAAIRAHDNVPVFSYLFLRGRCRRCGARISPRYLLVELLGIGLGLATYYHVVMGAQGTPVWRLASFLVAFFFAAGLLAILFIDVQTLIIPDAITLPMLLTLPAAWVALGHLGWMDAVMGAVLGFGVIWLVRELWFLLRGQEGIGLGDAKLLAVVGGVLGWAALPTVLLLASVQGLLIAIPLRLAGRSLIPGGSYQGVGVRARGAGAKDAPGAAPPEDGPGTAPPEDGPGEDRGGSGKGRSGEHSLSEGHPGERSSGERSPGEGDLAEGDLSKGDRSEGDRSEGDRSEGDRSKGDRSEGDLSKDDLSKGDRSKGDLADGGLSDGDSSKGDLGEEDSIVDEVPEGALPFGPFLALAAVETLFVGSWIRDRLLLVAEWVLGPM